jgi:OFA family oxalate/formate antiporter-like MFS transporter
MADAKVMNRWLVVVGAILIQLCLGAIYAWSVFTPALKETDKAELVKMISPTVLGLGEEEAAAWRKHRADIGAADKAGDPDRKKAAVEAFDSFARATAPTVSGAAWSKHYFGFSAAQTQWVFGVGLAVFAVVMVLAGQLQAKIGPRPVTIMGGVLLGLGYVLAGVMGQTFPMQILFIGVLGGAGIGLAYVCPIKVGMAWFPDKKGMITGLAVAGFGFGALIWIKLAGSWGNLIANLGLLTTFWIYGVAFAAMVLVGSVWMVNPPEGWKPEGWQPPQADASGKPAAGAIEMTPGRMLATPQFYGLWIMFVFSGMAGLMTIGIIKLFGLDALQKAGMDLAKASAVAGTAWAVFGSIANGIGRIVWGSLSDKLGRKACLFLMCLFQGIIMLAFYYMGGSEWGLYVGAMIIGFNFGGNFSLFPTATADFFGAKSVGLNYGWVFTAYGVGGIVGPIMAGYIRDVWQNFQAAFIISGVACLVAAVIALLLRPPKVEAAAAPAPAAEA